MIINLKKAKMAFHLHAKNFLNNLDRAKAVLDFDQLNRFIKLISSAKEQGSKVLFFGNGGSAAVASHLSVDLMRSLNIRGLNFNEADLITCFSNDFGYGEWVAKTIKLHADHGDVVVLVSSSGESLNIINAAKIANDMGLDLVTFSGFDKNNRLRKLGSINFWVDSTNYNVVEMTHHIWLLAMVEALLETEM